MTGGNSVVRWRTRMAAYPHPPSLSGQDTNSPERYGAGMCLKTEEARKRVLQSAASARHIRVGEGRCREAVQKGFVGVALHPDFEVIPFTWLQRRTARVLLLPGGGADIDIVNGASPMFICLIGLSGIIDLNLKTSIDREPSGITGNSWIIQTDRWRLPRIPEAHKHARIVAAGIDTELQAQREIGECLRGIEQEADIRARLSYENLLPGIVLEVARAGLLPVRKAGRRSI